MANACHYISVKTHRNTVNINVNYGIQIYQYWLNCNKYTTLMQKITKGGAVCMGAEHTGTLCTLYSFFCKLNCPKKLVCFFFFKL